MRVARGMFRLWLVLSCLWIATVAAIEYSSWSSSTVQQAATSKDPKAHDPKTSADDDLNSKMTILDQASKGTLRPLPDLKDASKDSGEAPNNPNWWDSSEELGSSAIAVPKAVHASTGATGDSVVTTAELALIPPVLIFIVGIGLTWALRGFRPR